MYYTAAIYHGALLNMNNDYKCHFSGAPINATPISCRYRVYFSCWLDYRKMIKHFGGNRSGKDNDTRMPNVFTGRELTQSVGAAAASTNKNVFQLLLPRTKPHLIFNFSFFLPKIFLGCLFFITPFYALSHLIISFLFIFIAHLFNKTLIRSASEVKSCTPIIFIICHNMFLHSFL